VVVLLSGIVVVPVDADAETPYNMDNFKPLKDEKEANIVGTLLEIVGFKIVLRIDIKSDTPDNPFANLEETVCSICFVYSLIALAKCVGADVQNYLNGIFFPPA